MPRPRVVLDTNVVVSAHLKAEGFERFVLDLAIAGKLRLFVSPEILEEYRGVLVRPKFRIARKHVERSMPLIQKRATVIEPKMHVTAASDPDDNKFLECAETAGADFLVTGNKRHFPKKWAKTSVVNAKKLIMQIAPDLEA